MHSCHRALRLCLLLIPVGFARTCNAAALPVASLCAGPVWCTGAALALDEVCSATEFLLVLLTTLPQLAKAFPSIASDDPAPALPYKSFAAAIPMLAGLLRELGT